jgi:transcriptional regulator with XRE-family HTH domain
MLFADLRMTLISVLRARVRNGELTERGLARLVGVSQPHIHNVLKGARTLSPELSDQILQHLRISLLDLIERDRIEAHLDLAVPAGAYVYVPLLRGNLGPGLPWPTEMSQSARLPFAASQVAAIRNPVAVRLSEDARMRPVFAAGDIALLDQSHVARTDLNASAYYVVKMGNGGVIRRVEISGNALYLIPEDCQSRPLGWQRIAIQGRPLTQLIRARASVAAPIYEWSSS